jgi:RsiW-degrading membrane proteinase PrsW (M82 family)
MAWIYLLFAGLLEIVWAVSMKQSEGFTRLTPTVVTIIGMIASFWLLAVAMRSLPLGTAYDLDRHRRGRCVRGASCSSASRSARCGSVRRC